MADEQRRMDTLTPEAMLSCPRPSAHIASPSGLRFAQVTSTFDFRSRRTTKTLTVTELSDDESSNKAQVVLQNLRSTDFAWVDDGTLIFTRKSSEKSQVDATLSDKQQKKVWAAVDDDDDELWAIDITSRHQYKVTSLPTSVGDLKIHVQSTTSAILVFSAVVYLPDRDIHNAKKRSSELEDEKNGSEIKVYDKLFIRHWDRWEDHNAFNQLHIMYLTKGDLPPKGDKSPSLKSLSSFESDEGYVAVQKDSQWTTNGKIVSPMASTELQCPSYPDGGTSEFDVNGTHLAFIAKDPNLNPAIHTKKPVYLISLEPKNGQDTIPKAITGNVGATSHPIFSPDNRIAWLEMREDGYEADKQRVMVYNIESGHTRGLTEDWDRSPSVIEWAPDGKSLYLLAEEDARTKIFHLPLESSAKPTPLTSDHSVNAITALATPSSQSDASSRILFSQTSLRHPNVVKLLDVEKNHAQTVSNIAGQHLSHIKINEPDFFWFRGAYEGQDVHGLVLRPPTFPAKDDASSLALEEGKWPMVFLVHGGPQGAWSDGWSTRWNLATWAAKGYIVVAVNPTGSTGYGQHFCDSIKHQWGGLPYKDLLAGYQFALKNFPEIDPERTAMAGASYGGYMANWIQGHNIFGFKAIICHDGIFDTKAGFYGTEELYFPEREYDGTPFANPENYEKWNPANHVANWSTPELIIHSALDFRLPDTEGIAAFNTLQRLGVPSRFVHFQSENHFVLNPNNSAAWHGEVFKWLAEWIGVGRSKEQKEKGYDVRYHSKTESGK